MNLFMEQKEKAKRKEKKFQLYVFEWLPNS